MARDEINAFLGSGTIYTGDLSFEGAVRIDGTFSGNITSEGTLIVGQGANVKGTLKVGALVASGAIEGNVVVSGKAVLHKSATLQGKLSTKLLVMEEGAMLDGDLCMRNIDKTEESLAVNNQEWPAIKESLQ